MAHTGCYAHLYIDNEDGVYAQFANYYDVFGAEFMLYFVTFIQSRLQKQADLSQYLS